MKIKVLYVQHTGVFGGSSKSLFEMIKAFPENEVTPYLICPKGAVSDYADELNIQYISTLGISQFDHSKHGYYKNLRWLILIRELFYFPFTILALVKARNKWKNVDIVHLNDFSMLAVIVLAKKLFHKPIVMHIRTLFNKDNSLRQRIIVKIYKHYVDRIIAIDKTVQKSLPAELVSIVIHNGFNSNVPMMQTDESANRFLTRDYKKPTFTIAMVGSLIKYKGVHEYIISAKQCKDQGLKIKFLLVGDIAKRKRGAIYTIKRKLKFEHNIKNEIIKTIEEEQLQDYVFIIPFTPNIKQVYDAINLLCFPSYLNAVGRPVFEAAFSKVTSIVAIDNPDDDTIIDKVTGICIPSKNPNALTKAIKYCYEHPEDVLRMGNEAFKLAVKNFNPLNNSLEVLKLYKSISMLI